MEGFRFTPEALEYEQKKEERLLREAQKSAFEMSKAESEELLDDMGEYRKGLQDAVREKKAELKNIKDRIEKAKLRVEIAELEEQITGLSEFGEAGEDAEEFTIK